MGRLIDGRVDAEQQRAAKKFEDLAESMGWKIYDFHLKKDACGITHLTLQASRDERNIRFPALSYQGFLREYNQKDVECFEKLYNTMNLSSRGDDFDGDTFCEVVVPEPKENKSPLIEIPKGWL